MYPAQRRQTRGPLRAAQGGRVPWPRFQWWLTTPDGATVPQPRRNPLDREASAAMSGTLARLQFAMRSAARGTFQPMLPRYWDTRRRQRVQVDSALLAQSWGNRIDPAGSGAASRTAIAARILRSDAEMLAAPLWTVCSSAQHKLRRSARARRAAMTSLWHADHVHTSLAPVPFAGDARRAKVGPRSYHRPVAKVTCTGRFADLYTGRFTD